MTKTLHLFRHGQTDWNILRRLQGHTDIPLNDIGREQARNLQHFFAENPVHLFLSSDLSRARETAFIANELLQKPLHTHAGLRESHMGDLEGKTRDEILSQYGENAWEKWSSVSDLHKDFRFPGSESAQDTVSRVLATLKNFCQTNDFEAAGICTHGLVMRRVLHFIKPELTEMIAVPNCAIYTIQWRPDTQDFLFE